MTTNFPTSVDAFTNPTSNDTLDNPPHDQQHADINDAMEAVQTSLLDGAPLKIDDANNRVGIGTTSPATILEVAGAAAHIRITDSDTAGTTGIDFYDSNGTADVELEVGNSTQYFAIKTAGSERMRIDSSGKVGIGTTSPSELLDINAGTAGSVELSTTGGRTIQLTANDSEPYLSVGSTTSHSAAIMTNGVRRLTVDSSGKVGIGTISPNHALHIVSGTGVQNLRCHNDSGSEGFRVAASLVRSSSIANLTTASAANVFINSSNNSIYRSTSSAKYKTDIETLEDEYADIVFELRPVWYRSTTGNDPEEYSYYGLIAEEVAQVDPRLVHFGATADCGCVEDEDGHIEHEQACLTEPEGVFYERLVPHLINVVQRQQEQIDALTARIEALEAG